MGLKGGLIRGDAGISAREVVFQVLEGSAFSPDVLCGHLHLGGMTDRGMGERVREGVGKDKDRWVGIGEGRLGGR